MINSLVLQDSELKLHNEQLDSTVAASSTGEGTGSQVTWKMSQAHSILRESRTPMPQRVADTWKRIRSLITVVRGDNFHFAETLRFKELTRWQQ